jgi:hypothetical protein
MRLILHIGTEKTGTTAVQNFLYKNRDILLRNRIGLLESIDYPNNRKLYAYCLPENEFDDYFWDLNIRDVEAKRQYFKNFEQELADEIGNLESQADTVIISSEHFHSRLKDTQSIENLKSILEPYFEEINVVCYFREQGAVIKSLYSTSMKNGHTYTLEAFTNKCLKNEHYFDYNRFLNKWADVFGKENIKARIFSRKSLHKGDICIDFIRLFDEHLSLHDFEHATEHDNPSLGRVGLFLARISNRFNPRYTKNGRRSFRSRLFLKIIEKNPFSYIGKLEFKRVREVRDFYSESNRQFARTYLEMDRDPFSS